MSFSTTVQFPSKEDYRRLKVLAAVRDEPVGVVLAGLVDEHFSQLSQVKIDKILKEQGINLHLGGDK